MGQQNWRACGRKEDLNIHRPCHGEGLRSMLKNRGSVWKMCLSTHSITMEDRLLSLHTIHLCMHDSSFQMLIGAYLKKKNLNLSFILFCTLACLSLTQSCFPVSSPSYGKGPFSPAVAHSHAPLTIPRETVKAPTVNLIGSGIT